VLLAERSDDLRLEARRERLAHDGFQALEMKGFAPRPVKKKGKNADGG